MYAHDFGIKVQWTPLKPATSSQSKVAELSDWAH